MQALPNPRSAVLRYRGGKVRIAPWIIGHFPPHESYVEPYAGGAAVLMRKPRARFETLNDLDGEVVNFWRVLREQTDKFCRVIELTPWSRAEFYAAREPADDLLERARRFYVSIWQGYAKTLGSGGWRHQIASNGWGVNRPIQFNRTDHLNAAVERLMGVQLECRPALDVIKAWDRPEVLIYADPPYLPATRERSRNLYACEMDEADHRVMADALLASKAMVVLSGYPHGLYDEWFKGWRCETLETLAEAQKTSTEALWINPAADRALQDAEMPLFRNQPKD